MSQRVVKEMANIDDLIEYHDEEHNLDFKGAQYPKEKHADLIKDLIAMANADTNDGCYIIIGVIRNSEGQKELRGINREYFIDDAVYQQLIRENVEPDVNFEYILHEYAGKCFGVFRIGKCDDKPYIMKKDYKKLKTGDSWIRKGTHQPRMIRRDFDAIYEQKMASIGFNGHVEILFEENESDNITIPTARKFTFPSEREAKKIRRTIERKKNPDTQKPEIPSISAISGLDDILYTIYGAKPYHKRTLEELEENLENVRRDFTDEDEYFRFEKNGYKLNIILHNKGEQYIEDGEIRVHIPKVEGLFVAPRVAEEPNRDPYGYNIHIYPEFPSKYPEITESETYTVIMESVGNIKHHIPILAFEEPIRVFFSNSLSGKSIEIKCEIFGRNLRKPITKILEIHLMAPIHADDKDRIHSIL